MSQQAESKLSADAVFIPTRELILIPVEGGYILDGGRQPEMLTGPVALSTLPVILPLIDGTRSLAQLVAAVPQIERSGIEKVVEQLLSWGVLALQDEGTAALPAMRNTLSLLKRGDGGASLEAAASVLANTEIVIVCDEQSRDSGQEVAKALNQNGFCHVEVHSGIVLPAAGRDTLVISMVNEVSSHSVIREQYARVLATGCRWLRVSVGAKSAEIGPILTADTNLCLTCLVQALPEEESTSFNLSRTDRVAWSAMLASEVTALLLTPSPASRAFRRYRLPSLQSEVRTWPVEGLCFSGHRTSTSHQQDIALNPERGERKASLPLLYEEAIASRQEINDADAGTPDAPPTSTKKMLSSASISLPAMKLDLPQRVFNLLLSKQRSQETSLRLEAVAQLLALAVGVKTVAGNETRRWVPSGGNLGSAEAYLVAIDVEGLAPGVYFYRSEEHILKKLNQRNIDHVRAACEVVHEGKGAAAMVVLVGAYHRIGRKYGPFAYKLAHLDAGAASSQLLLTASALGVNVRNARSWDSRNLADALLLRADEEAVTQVFCVGARRGASANAQEPDMEATRESSPRACGPINSDADFPHEALMEALTALDSFVEDRLPDRIGPSMPLALNHLRTLLLARARSRVTLGAALNKRSSQRTFSSGGIKLADIELLLRAALHNDAFADSRLSVSILVQRLAACDPGVYRFEPRAKRLVRKRHAFSREQVERLFLTKDYGDTPLVFWIGGRVSSTTEPGRNRGEYQTLLLRAGLLGHRLWMAALGLGLQGALVAGIRSGATSRSEQFMENGEVSLLAFTCGHPKQTEAGEVQNA